MSIISDGQSVLNDLFTNNVDFVAKQMQVLIDFLFPDNEDNNETPYPHNPYMVSGQCIGAFGSYASGGMYRDVFGLYNVNFSSVNHNPYITYISDFGDADNPNTYNQIVTEHINNYSIQLQSQYVGHDIALNTDFSPAPLWDYDLNERIKSNWTNQKYNVQSEGFTAFLYSKTRSVSWNENQSACPTITLVSVDDTKTFVITDPVGATSIYNDYISYNNDYHTINTYNFDGGSVTVGGGAGGIVVGLGGAVGYADIKFALDSLIDDLNLNFNNADNKLPITEFPSYYDVKYEDMGAFYIEPLHQYDTLPSAPIFEGELQLEEYPKYIGTAAQTLLDLLPGVGLSALCAVCFLVGLITSKIRG